MIGYKHKMIQIVPFSDCSRCKYKYKYDMYKYVTNTHMIQICYKYKMIQIVPFCDCSRYKYDTNTNTKCYKYKMIQIVPFCDCSRYKYKYDTNTNKNTNRIQVQNDTNSMYHFVIACVPISPAAL